MDNSTNTQPPPLTAHLTASGTAQQGTPGTTYTPPSGLHLGREHLKWGPEIWERIDRAVHHEAMRTRVGARFLPHHRVDPHVTTVPADTVLASLGGTTPFSNPVAGAVAFAAGAGGAAAAPVNPPATPPLLNIDEGAFIRVVEIWTEFSLTAAQVQKESELSATAPEPHGVVSTGPDKHEHHPASTAVTLARRATNTLCLAQDTVLFQGADAFAGLQGVAAVPGNTLPGSPLFQSETVLYRGIPVDTGLLSIGGTTPLLSSQVLPVYPTNGVVPTAISTTQAAALTSASIPALTPSQVAGLNSADIAVLTTAQLAALTTAQIGYLPASGIAALTTAQSAALVVPPAPSPATYVENTVAAINNAYSLLSANGYPGPYVCVLHYYPYADSFAPLPNTLILPADRIRPIMEEGYLASSALPGLANPKNNGGTNGAQAYGLVISLGGNTVDLVNGLDPITAFSQIDGTGNYIFRVLTRFALRLKDPGSVIRLEFQ